jgi:alpha-glucosidase (family GH31 glycosyl hydrolase)
VRLLPRLLLVACALCPARVGAAGLPDLDAGRFSYQRVGDSAWHRDGAVDVAPAIGGVVRVAFRPPAGAPIAWTRFEAPSDASETLLGLGERFEGVPLAGKRIELWAVDRRDAGYGDSTYLPVPWLVSSRGYGLLLDDARRSVWDLRAERPDAWTVAVPGDGLALYLVEGTPAQALERYTALTGRPPLPPRWSLGVVKTLIGGQEKVLRDAARLKQLGVPVDGIYAYDAVDELAGIGWPHSTYAGVPTGPYADVARFNARLRAMGYRPLGYFGPDARPEWRHFAHAAERGYLVRGRDDAPWVHPTHGISLLDFLRPEAVHWWQGGPLARALTDLGFDGGMLDLGEAVPAEARFADGRSGLEAHNVYPAAYVQAGHAALRDLKPDGLFWMRSGWTGAQAAHAATWPGDPWHSWEPVVGIKSMVPAALSAGLAGYAYWHAEVAGYVDAGLDPASERELYLRWLELGAFTAMLRDQYGDRDGVPTHFWSDDETVALWREYAILHQRLGPYLWAAAQEAHATGMPLMRHLALMYPDDPTAWTLDQQYLLGPDLLVAPVVEPGAREWAVYLPPGEWRHWWSGVLYAGPGWLTVPAPLGQIPFFVREGTQPL